MTEATAGVDNGVWSLFTNSAEKIWRPGVTLGQVYDVAATWTTVPGADKAGVPLAMGGTASMK